MATVNAFNNGDPKMVAVPTLRRVRFEDYVHDDILRYLALPALETLSVPLCTIMDDDFLAFLERSGVSLWDLTLGSRFRDMARDWFNLHEYLRPVPSLSKFTMWLPDSEMVAELFAALGDSSLLPTLHDLTIHLDDKGNPRISDFSWRTLALALSNRRIEQLYIVPIVTSPCTDVLNSLCELVSNGAKMWIGTEQRNFVVS
ncbi:hypothetical protein MSAN_00437700 [Mycena sanguinolenta]|uniref:Uncharacterized protein n=1 Tax=Mycena sanguinolenta TaxID=230812 RepID=A0A8H6ZD65_9AGAR|nr:hypothetical protein MSAN_00437700 [Mycena sanguinolenta]